jgi:hypothetical protein
MYRSYITNNTATNVLSGRAAKVVVQVNKDLTGTIKVIDGTSGTTANVATITNPTVGSRYEYYGFQDGVRIIASGACDITVAAIRRRGY